MIAFRPYELERDAPRHAQLLTQHGPEPITAAELVRHEGLRPIPESLLALSAVDSSGELIGFGEVQRKAWYPAGLYRFELLVDPAYRRRGIGTGLANELTAFVRQHGGTRLSADVRDHLPDALQFAEQRGFEVDRHMFESTLDLPTFDETPLANAIARAESSGIVFRSLADYGDTEAARRKVYDLNIACIRDLPGHEGPDRPWDEFKKIFEMHWFWPDGQVLAVDPSAATDPRAPDVERDRFVALAAVGYFKETNSVYHMHTGVDRPYRGRGLALATKLVALRVARRWGAAYARTNNDSTNAPILAVNRKLGYVPQPGYYKLIKRLA